MREREREIASLAHKTQAQFRQTATMGILHAMPPTLSLCSCL